MIDVRLVPPLGDNVTFVPRTPLAERLREHALRIVRDTIEAADPRPLVTRAIDEMHLDPDRVIVVSVGKAAVAMAAGARAALGSERLNGIVVAPTRSGAEIPGLHVFEAAHPLPGASSVAAAEAVVRLLEQTSDADDVLLLLSGGASSLLAYPAGDVTIQDYARVTSLLLEHGAGIHALNSVRKHIDRLKGGQLARLAAPARVHALLLSDVVDDREDTIGSGPAAPDTTTYQEAIWNLHTLECWAGTPERVRRHLERGRDGELPETPRPGDPLFDRVTTQVIGSNALARNAAADAARALGYDVVVQEQPITGEAREAGVAFVRAALQLHDRAAGRPIALIGGGETTVTVTGDGRGGRNQELALAAALVLDGIDDVLVASVGTDGIDGPTSVAGAIADGESVRRAAARGVDARASLDDNDAFGFFGALHDLVLTGPTGTNLLDVQVALIGVADS